MGRIITRPLDYDPVMGIRETFHYDPDTEEAWVEYEEDLQTVVDTAKALHADTDERARYHDGFNHVGYIPPIIQHMHPELMYDNKALAKWLNNPDNRFFRTRPGKI